MQALNNPDLLKQLQHFLRQHDNTFTWVETHGLLCAMAVGPAPADGWQQLIYLDDENDQQAAIPTAINRALTYLVERIASDIVAGEGVALPCRLDPYEENEGLDLASWCSGFLTGVFQQEAQWYQPDEDTTANLLLPLLLISGLDEDELFDELWENTTLVRKMALGMPDLLEELFLYFHAPDLPDE